jgi:mono/diheme cytochrome c family protein
MRSLLACCVAFALAGCLPRGGEVDALTDAQVDAARTRSPDVTRAQLERGRRLALVHCGDCHAVPAPRDQRAEQWPETIARMAGRAGLAEVQDREAVARFYVAAAP